MGDVEIVAAPRYEVRRIPRLFEDGVERIDMLWTACADVSPAVLAPHPRKAWGEKYKRLVHVPSGLQVDLFVVTPPAEWGPIFAIRTGPADYSQRAVTWLRSQGMRCEDGRIMRGDEVVPCPDEATFFRLAGMKYDPPEERW